MLESTIIYLSLGAFAGLAAGMLGVGGGLIIVPILAILFQRFDFSSEVYMHMAIGTSLATIVVTSLSSVYSHHRRGAVLWRCFMRLSPGILLGAWGGAVFASFLPAANLKLIFAVFELLVAAQMGFGFKINPSRTLPGVWVLTCAGGVIGAISSLVGIGGGSLTVPYLSWCGVPIKKAIATSAACGLPIAVAGALGYLITGWGHTALPQWSGGYIYWPAFLGIVISSFVFAPLGAHFAHSLSKEALRIVFAIFLLILAIWMLSTL